MIYVLFGVAALFFVWAIFAMSHQSKLRGEFHEKEGLQKDGEIKVGKYLHGHPDLDKPISKVSIYLKDGVFLLYGFNESNPFLPPTKMTEISKESIKTVVLEDATTIEKRVTVGRLLAVGVFAFALKKTEKNELSYLVISWNDGKFDHETIFEFEGMGAVESANTARNQFIRVLR